MAGLRRERLLAVGERLIEGAAGRLVGDPVDEQPEQGGAEERGEGGYEQSFHGHRRVERTEQPGRRVQPPREGVRSRPVRW